MLYVKRKVSYNISFTVLIAERQIFYGYTAFFRQRIVCGGRDILLEIKYEEKPAGTEKLYFNNVKTKTEVNLTKNTYTATGTTTNVRASSYGCSMTSDTIAALNSPSL